MGLKVRGGVCRGWRELGRREIKAKPSVLLSILLPSFLSYVLASFLLSYSWTVSLISPFHTFSYFLLLSLLLSPRCYSSPPLPLPMPYLSWLYPSIRWPPMHPLLHSLLYCLLLSLSLCLSFITRRLPFHFRCLTFLDYIPPFPVFFPSLPPSSLLP